MGAASRIAIATAGAITTVILARVLGPDGWASYFLAQSLIVILLASTTLGIELGIAYYVSSAQMGRKSGVCLGSEGCSVYGCRGRRRRPMRPTPRSVRIRGAINLAHRGHACRPAVHARLGVHDVRCTRD